MVRRRLRSKKLRDKQKRQRIRRFGLIITAVIVLLGAVAGVSYINALEIHNVTVSGNSVVTTDELTHYIRDELSGRRLALFSRKNAFIYPKSAIVAGVYDRFTRVRDVDIGLKEINTLAVTVEERTPHALWCGDGSVFVDEDRGIAVGETPAQGSGEQQCYFLDDTGFIYGPAPHFTGYVFFTYYGPVEGEIIGSRYVDEDYFADVEFFIKSLRDLNLNPIAFARFDTGESRVYLQKETGREGSIGGYIIFHSGDDLDAVYENIRVLIEKEVLAEKLAEAGKDAELAYIDLRYGNKVFYRIRESQEK